MDDTDTTSYPPGVQPYDALNAVRIGALVGGVVGIVVSALLGGAFIVLIAGAALGALGGWGWHRRERRRGS